MQSRKSLNNEIRFHYFRSRALKHDQQKHRQRWQSDLLVEIQAHQVFGSLLKLRIQRRHQTIPSRFQRPNALVQIRPVSCKCYLDQTHLWNCPAIDLRYSHNNRHCHWTEGDDSSKTWKANNFRFGVCFGLLIQLKMEIHHWHHFSHCSSLYRIAQQLLFEYIWRTANNNWVGRRDDRLWSYNIPVCPFLLHT